ncbi:MAG: hypothetical protein LBB68_11780 [Treponema sp.]|jgi:hypothetical protein|nr:hypothetical protein [Treponema sp.]
MDRKLRRIIIIILPILGLLALGTALYTLRAPVLLVADDEYTGLYGLRRSWAKQIGISVKMFRRFKVVRMADGAAPDVTAFAVNEAASRPYAALFPFSYERGARRYAEQSPGIPVGVLGGGARSRRPAEVPGEENGLVFIETDRAADLYRAGRCAALFALRDGGGILFFTGDGVTWNDKDAFLKGLRDQGFEDPPMFVDIGEEYTLSKTLSCVVMARAVENYLDNNPTVPAILFSWMDPGITPREIKVIFDDSPWALAAAAAKTLHQRGGVSPVPSEIVIPIGRIGDAGLRRDIKRVLKAKY